ncbi:peptidase [Longibacter salinarum]|uniref:Peptidase n=1 Tax=Longibacter salinarum TaxID=1850348 RepID=A0A2A8CXB5_9BACT|nr:prohibitin family protein [Longibacter salinarum]PEN13028.1 peptidase [Longibacter salinarum]
MASYPNLTKAALRVGGAIVGLIFFAILIPGCMSTTVESGEAAVKYSVFGGTNLDNTVGEGLKVHAPWVDIIRYDVRVQEQLEKITALSSNGLSIGMDVSVRWKPDAGKLPQLHTTYGTDYYKKLVQPELRSAAREVVGLFTPEELYSSKREELQTEMIDRVRTGVETEYVTIEAVLIRDVRLPQQIQSAIENKLKEEQEAQRYEYTLQKEELEAERKRIEAEGEAEYQRIITESLSPEFLRFKGIEATRELAQSSNSKVVVVGGSESGGLPIILGGQ